MFEIVYRSRSLAAFSSEGLAQMIEQARSSNFTNNITGLLVFDGTHFLQILEGEKPAIESLFDTIRNDSRHFDVEQLWSQSSSPIGQRAFANWSMGSIRLASGALEPSSELTAFQKTEDRNGLSYGARLFRVLSSSPNYGAAGLFMPNLSATPFDLSVSI